MLTEDNQTSRNLEAFYPLSAKASPVKHIPQAYPQAYHG
jgi:hypothetical protein